MVSLRLNASRIALATSMAVVACEDTADEYRTRHETEKTVVRMPAGDPGLCAGDLLFLDQHASELEMMLDAESQEKIEINLTHAVPVAGCSGNNSGGCVVHGEVFTRWWALPHEMVHVVSLRVGRPAPFWHEGLAEALSGRTTRKSVSVLDEADKPTDEVDYLTAGHFVRWLLEERGGVQGILPVLAGESFAEAYGMTLEEAVTSYDTEAPWKYPAAAVLHNPVGESCSGERLDPDPTAIVPIRIDCASADASRFDNQRRNLSTSRVIAITEPTTYLLQLDGGQAATILGCVSEEVQSEPANKKMGDVGSELETAPVPTVYESGMEHEVHLVPGEYRFSFWASTNIEAETVYFSMVPL